MTGKINKSYRGIQKLYLHAEKKKKLEFSKSEWTRKISIIPMG